MTVNTNISSYQNLNTTTVATTSKEDISKTNPQLDEKKETSSTSKKEGVSQKLDVCDFSSKSKRSSPVTTSVSSSSSTETKHVNQNHEKMKNMIRMMKALFGDSQAFDDIMDLMDEQEKKLEENTTKQPQFNKDGIRIYDPANPVPGLSIHDGILGLTFPKHNNWQKIIDLPDASNINARMEQAVKVDFINWAKKIETPESAATLTQKDYVFALAKKGGETCFSAFWTLDRYRDGYIDALSECLYSHYPNFKQGDYFDPSIFDELKGRFGEFCAEPLIPVRR